MAINIHYRDVQDSYLFSRISRKVADYEKAHPEADIIKLGIGDVTLPLCDAVIKAMHTAVDDMSRKETFRGYAPEQGYDFLRTAIWRYYTDRGLPVEYDEIFVSDGAKSDLGNILDLFDASNTVFIPDPVYPAYVDTNVMAGHDIRYMDANEQNGFLPMPDDRVRADIIYLCSPNNPTGAVYNARQLQAWVDYANATNAVILFDAAYESFVSEDLPRSIFEIEGARKCAVEFCSLSKTAGFTGTRCGYTVVPKSLIRDDMNLNHMWLRRQTTKFNGVAYIIQRGAEAVFSRDGQKQIRENIAYYRENAWVIASALRELGIGYTGGSNSPYIWMKCPDHMTSWDFFDVLLEKANVVGTPGEGFGRNGEGFFRLTAFGDHARTVEAVKRIRALLE